jgi:hypothetical protein
MALMGEDCVETALWMLALGGLAQRNLSVPADSPLDEQEQVPRPPPLSPCLPGRSLKRGVCVLCVSCVCCAEGAAAVRAPGGVQGGHIEDVARGGVALLAQGPGQV